MLVFVTVDPSQGLRGLRGVVIQQGTPGIKILRETEERKLGMRYLRQSTIEFVDLRIPYDNMLGDPDDPNSLLEGLNVLNQTRPFCMAWNVGTLLGAADFVHEWARSQTTGPAGRRDQCDSFPARADRPADGSAHLEAAGRQGSRWIKVLRAPMSANRAKPPRRAMTCCP